MSSIRSTLIRSCFANIQRELLQLEDWLNRDFADVPNATANAKSSTDSSIIYEAIQQLSKQMDSQQHTLHHIIDRIDVLEETRNIHIQEKDDGNLWLDSEGVQLQNEIVDYESIVNVNKTEAATEVKMLPETVETTLPVTVAATATETVTAAASVAATATEPVAAAVTVVAPVEEAVKNVVVQPEEEEDEDGLEEVEYNGTTYYRDSNLVMYQLDDEGELTDAVGVWKEKTQTIKFYKK